MISFIHLVIFKFHLNGDAFPSDIKLMSMTENVYASPLYWIITFVPMDSILNLWYEVVWEGKMCCFEIPTTRQASSRQHTLSERLFGIIRSLWSIKARIHHICYSHPSMTRSAPVAYLISFRRFESPFVYACHPRVVLLAVCSKNNSYVSRWHCACSSNSTQYVMRAAARREINRSTEGTKL